MILITLQSNFMSIAWHLYLCISNRRDEKVQGAELYSIIISLFSLVAERRRYKQ